jgi:hypothetical protein
VLRLIASCTATGPQYLRSALNNRLPARQIVGLPKSVSVAKICLIIRDERGFLPMMFFCSIRWPENFISDIRILELLFTRLAIFCLEDALCLAFCCLKDDS